MKTVQLYSTLTDVLQAKGYHVVESDGKELVEKAIATQPDIIILEFRSFGQTGNCTIASF